MTTLTESLGADDDLPAALPPCCLRPPLQQIRTRYIRMLTGGQKLDRQLDVLAPAEIIRELIGQGPQVTGCRAVP